MSADNLAAIYRQAAAGDVQALSNVVDMILALPIEGVCGEDEAACGAEILARISATGGGEKELLRLAGVLMIRAGTMRSAGNSEREAIFLGEVIEILFALADRGSEVGATCLIHTLGEIAADGVPEAREMLEIAVANYGAEGSPDGDYIQILMSPEGSA